MKAITDGNYIVRPFVTHKTQTYGYAFLSGGNPAQVSIDLAVVPPTSSWQFSSGSEPINPSGIFKTTLYESVKHLFYDTSTVDRVFQPTGSALYVVSVAQPAYGEAVQPGSFSLTEGASTGAIIDDGNGGLVYSGSASSSILTYAPGDTLTLYSGSFSRPSVATYNQSVVPLVFEYNTGDSVAAKGGTFSRVSIAYYVSQSGLLATASVNVLRDNHYIGGVRTTFLEKASTNLQYPSVPTSSLGVGLVMTGSFAVAPDGTGTATRVSWTGSANSFYLGPVISSVAGTMYTVSCFMKPNVASSIIALQHGASDSSTYARYEVNLTTLAASTSSLNSGSNAVTNVSGSITPYANGWYRLALHGVHSTVLSFDAGFTVATNAAGDINIWGLQLEAAPVASSYIPTTTGPATRATDNLWFPTTFLPSECTLFADWYDMGSARNNVVAGIAPRVLQIGTNSFAYDSFHIAYNGGPFAFHKDSSGAFNASNPGGTYNIGDRIQVRGLFRNDGQVASITTRNGTDFTGAFTTAALPLTGSFTSATITLNASDVNATDAGWIALVSARVIRGIRSAAEVAAPNSFPSGTVTLLATASTGVMRDLNYIGTTRSVLLENARSNIAINSFSGWTPTGTVISQSAAVGPDGLASAWKLADDATTANHYTRFQSNITASSTYTVSCYVKQAERPRAFMYLDEGAGSSLSYEFDLVSGSVTLKKVPSGIWSNVTASAVYSGNGWYRCVITGKTTAATLGVRIGSATPSSVYDAFGVVTGSGVVGAGVFLAMPQVEQGDYASSYIPTGATIASRSADILKYPYFDNPAITTVTSTTVATPTGSQYTGYSIRSGSLFVETSGSLTSLSVSRPTNTTRIGNIFYSSGIAVINGSTFRKFPLTDGGIQLNTGSLLNIKFDATHTIYEHYVICTLDQGELNYSMNPSVKNNAADGFKVLDHMATGSLHPYMTQIGLYNDDGELVAIGKFPRPLKRAVGSQQTVIIRFDA